MFWYLFHRFLILFPSLISLRHQWRISCFSFSCWLHTSRKKLTALDSLNADTKTATPTLLTSSCLVLTIYRIRLKKFTDFQPVACIASCRESFVSESRYYRVTRRPHATLSVLIYKRIIDVTQFTWQYSRNCRKNVTITRNLRYRLSILVALCGNFHLSSSRLLFFTLHAIFAITLLRTLQTWRMCKIYASLFPRFHALFPTCVLNISTNL